MSTLTFTPVRYQQHFNQFLLEGTFDTLFDYLRDNVAPEDRPTEVLIEFLPCQDFFSSCFAWIQHPSDVDSPVWMSDSLVLTLDPYYIVGDHSTAKFMAAQDLKFQFQQAIVKVPGIKLPA